jgi:hypothetical protein
MALYATVSDSSGNVLANFNWNNANNEVDEVNTYNINNDPTNPNIKDLDISSWCSISVSAFTDDDLLWPNSANHENDLGSTSLTFEPRSPRTLGSLTIGPTTTENANIGYLVNVDVSVISDPSPAEIRIQFENLILYEDEDAGGTHMAVYVHAQSPARNGLPALDAEIFRWNNANNEVDEVNNYNLDTGGSPSSIIRLNLNGPAVIWIEGFTHDDENWPSSSNKENSLGSSLIYVDPSDPSTLGRRHLGPTTTDNGNNGYLVNLSIDVLHSAGIPNLSIVGIEVTQAIQHFQSAQGQDNSVPLVANKRTMVRAYIDSGVDSSIDGGFVPNVTGILTSTGSANLSIFPMGSITAGPISTIDRSNLSDTLNFVIPEEQARGIMNLTVQANVGGSVSSPSNLSVTFNNVQTLKIMMIRIHSSPSVNDAPSRTQFLAAVNRLPMVYPIPTNPGLAITYWLPAGSEVITNTHNLTTQDGMNDLLDDVDDIQDDYASDFKAYGMVSVSASMARFGMAEDDSAIGYSCIMESIAHEIGHLYGLDHAPCGNPPDPDDDFIPPNGRIGEVGVDVVGLSAFPASGVSEPGDFMSYCGSASLPCVGYENQWISAYHWTNLLDRFRSR